MDISPAGPVIAPWLVLVIVVVVVLAVLGAFLLHRGRAARRLPPGEDGGLPRGYEQDDLPGFLQSPPGTAGRADPPPGGWASLAGSTGAASQATPAPADRTRSRAVLAGVLAAAALLVVAVLVAVQGSPGRHGTQGRDRDGAPRTTELPAPPPAPAPGDPGAGELADATVRPGRDGGAVRLEFGGLVLEQRAVGVTVTYPVLEGTWNARQGVAHVRLPTFNCLASSAPDEPVAAGCTPTVGEYADLPSPALAVTWDDGTVQLAGRFPTYVRPNGSPPVWTGRVYEIRVRAAPVAGAPQQGWVRAEGEIRLGSDEAHTLAGSQVRVPRRD